MAKHRGEILKKIIDDCGIPVTKIAEKSKVSRATIYSLFDQAEAGLDHIIKIGKAIDYDFSIHFPELKAAVSKEQEENLNYKLKYFELLEKHLSILEEREEEYKKSKKKK